MAFFTSAMSRGWDSFALFEVDVHIGHAGKRFQSLGYGLLAMVAGHAFHSESGHNRILSG